MALFDKNRFASAKQEWETPQDMFDALNSQYKFTFDLAADVNNHKCTNYFGVTDDALKQKWRGRCWLNPPYGSKGETRLAKWIEKAYLEAQTGDCSVTMLIPARTNTEWWGKYCMQAREILFVIGRPKFEGAIHGLPQPLAIITFSKTSSPPRYGKYEVKNKKVILKD